MKVDLGLQVAANAFIEALTPILDAVERAGAPPAAAGRGTRSRELLAQEAFDLACAFIDCDRRATDEELWALIVAFAPVLRRDLLTETPATLRAARLTEGRRHFLDRPSSLFATLLAADRRDGSGWAMTYYEHAVALGFMTASLDANTDRTELVAIEAFRTMLLVAIRTGELPGGATGTGGSPGTTGSSTGTATDAGAGSGATAGPGQAGGAARAGDGPPSPGAAPTAAAEAAPPATAADEPLAPARPLDELLAELDGLVGLQAVKDEVKLVTNLLRVQQLRAQRGLGTSEQSHHLIFTGNPGTGKTTVARLLAQIYRTLGVVERGQLVETDRAGLVAGFVGQTATKVVAAFDRADGGVLLIDEAYALVRGSENDFGQEAIDTIVKLVEDRRDRVVVIAAGYPDEMGDFVGANPGLASRFPKTLRFPDYSTDELVAIFRDLCDDQHYLCESEAEARVRAWLEAQPRVKGFGNGRLVRNLFESVVARQASRVVELTDPTDLQLVLLLGPDIPDPVPLPDAGPGSAGSTVGGAAVDTGPDGRPGPIGSS